MNRADFPYVLPIATRWIDNDVYGHVNNVVYYAYFDTVINQWLIDQGCLDIARSAVIGVCAESQCTYVQSASFPDALEAGLRVTKVGTTSVTYQVAIFTNRSDPNGISRNRTDPNDLSPNRTDPNDLSPNRSDPNDLSPNRSDPNGLCAYGRFVHVFVDRGSRKPTGIPSQIRAALERLALTKLQP